MLRSPLFDTHFHIAAADDAAALLADARSVGVTLFMVAAGDLAESRRAAALAAQFEDVSAMAGVHPHAAAGRGLGALAG